MKAIGFRNFRKFENFPVLEMGDITIVIVTGSRQKLGEHDRTIFTNNKLYTSGDSFNYFDSNGNKITKNLLRQFGIIQNE